MYVKIARIIVLWYDLSIDLSLFYCIGGIRIKQELSINEEIVAKEVNVIGDNGEQLGVMPVQEALKIAEEHELDLVEVAPNASPVVCKIMNYGKYKYEQARKEKNLKETKSCGS